MDTKKHLIKACAEHYLAVTNEFGGELFGGGFLFFILTPKVYFSWARGADSREQPKEERGKVR